MRSKAIVASLATAAVLTGPTMVGKLALAENTDPVATLDEGTYLIQPSETHPGYMLPPLSDHLLVARLNGDSGVSRRLATSPHTCGYVQYDPRGNDAISRASP